jgi:hypothetical protein
MCGPCHHLHIAIGKLGVNAAARPPCLLIPYFVEAFVYVVDGMTRFEDRHAIQMVKDLLALDLPVAAYDETKDWIQLTRTCSSDVVDALLQQLLHTSGTFDADSLDSFIQGCEPHRVRTHANFTNRDLSVTLHNRQALNVA